MMENDVLQYWARLENNTVVEIITFDPDGRFHPSLFWLPCEPEVKPGWQYVEGTMVPPPPQE